MYMKMHNKKDLQKRPVRCRKIYGTIRYGSTAVRGGISAPMKRSECPILYCSYCTVQYAPCTTYMGTVPRGYWPLFVRTVPVRYARVCRWRRRFFNGSRPSCGIPRTYCTSPVQATTTGSTVVVVLATYVENPGTVCIFD